MRSTIAAIATALVLAAWTVSYAQGQPDALQPVYHAAAWYNGRVEAGATKGKVVLVDVFTVDCINCRNVIPEIQRLQKAYGRKGLVVVGVHSPETSWEKDPRHVRPTLASLGVTWPVAIDDDFRIWHAYGVSAWPTQLIFDREGRLRATIVGDSRDAAVQRAVERLINAL